jgi:hypothetical protein
MVQDGTTQVGRKAILTKNMVIGPPLEPGLQQSRRRKNKEVKLNISNHFASTDGIFADHRFSARPD